MVWLWGKLREHAVPAVFAAEVGVILVSVVVVSVVVVSVAFGVVIGIADGIVVGILRVGTAVGIVVVGVQYVVFVFLGFVVWTTF